MSEKSSIIDNIDCNEIYKHFIVCKNSDGENSNDCKKLLEKYAVCSNKSFEKQSDMEHAIDELAFN